MTTIIEMLSKSAEENLSEQNKERLEAFGKVFVIGMVALACGINKLITGIQQAAIRAEEGSQRKWRYEVYKNRRRWRKSDLRKLQSLPLNKPAFGLMAEIDAGRKGGARGRGTVQPYVSLAERFVRFGEFVVELAAPETSPHRRLQLLKLTNSWPEFVEALYRGEYTISKAAGVPNPSGDAEMRVAEYLCISVPSLKRHRHLVRLDVKDAERSAPVTIVEFGYWQQNGEFPDVKGVQPIPLRSLPK